MALWTPAWMKDLIAWIHNPSIPMYGRWAHAAQNEGGVDLTSPGGTPVLALATGPIIAMGTFVHANGNPGYGVVTTRINVPGHGLQDLYYQHIDIAPGLKVGQIVQRGQVIGHVRSNVGEVEVGFNAGWGGIWGTHHPGPWVTDPRPWLAALLGGSVPNTSTTGVGNASTPGTKDAVPAVPTSPTSCAPWDIPCLLQETVKTEYFQRSAIVFAGIVLALIGVIVLAVGHGAKIP